MFEYEKCPSCDSYNLEYKHTKEEREAYGSICYESICTGYECMDCGYKEKY